QTLTIVGHREALAAGGDLAFSFSGGFFMSWFNRLRNGRLDDIKQSQPGIKKPARTNLVLETLEDRTLLSTLFVLTAGSPVVDNLFHFSTLQTALAAAKPGDIIQLEPGYDPGVFATANLKAAATAGATTITTTNLISPNEVITIDTGTKTERALVLSSTFD